MEKLKEKQPEDIYTGDAKTVFVKTLKDTTGYPMNLTADEVVRLIYFFGARKIAAKGMNKQPGRTWGKNSFGMIELKAIEKFFELFGLVYRDAEEFKTAYRELTLRFKRIIIFLKKHPAFITKEIYDALKTGGYGGGDKERDFRHRRE